MTTTGCPHLPNYAPLSPEQLTDPYPVWKEAQDTCPVFFAPEFNVWTATRYQDEFPDGVWSNAALINKDGDDHKKAKVLAQRAFIPSRVNRMRPAMEALA